MNKIILFACLSLLLGCESTPHRTPLINHNSYIESTYEAVDKLAAQLSQYTNYPNKNEPILVATLVSVDELESASRLGRSISEQVAARLTQKGFKVVEVKLRGSLFVKRAEGELLLSREIAQISQSYRAPAVVVGTYAPATNFVHINLKVVLAESQLVLAAADYGLPLDDNTKTLLHSGR
jgi:TolB-like protein